MDEGFHQDVEVPNATSDVETPVDALIGQIIDNRYEVLSRLGKGGMGSVYRVRETATGTEYALKMISPELADKKILAKRLEHEAIAAKTLTHANIAAIYDVGKAQNDAPYLVMDLIDGKGLDELLKAETVLTPDRAFAIFIQIAEALVHAHYKGVVHRDLKPSNILLTQTPSGQDFVKIVDFGIAKIADSHNSDKTKLTQAGELLGTPFYMSPEQCKGDDLDGRSDIYSLGCVMYEVLAGRPPFADNNPVKVLLKHISEQPPVLPKHAGISANLRSITTRCLEKDPADRYQTSQSLLSDLELAREGKPILQRSAPRAVLRKQKLILAASVAVIAIGAFASQLFVTRPTQLPPQSLRPVHEQRRPERFNGKTLSQWTNLIEQSPNDPELYLNRGSLHDIRDERTNALDDFTRAINLKPDYIAALIRRSYVYTLVADYKKALADATKVIALDPDSDGGYNVRAVVNTAMERFSQACTDYEKSIKLNDLPPAHYGLASARLKLGDYTGAQAAIGKAIENGQDYNARPSYEGLAGVISTFKRDFPDAEKWLTKATNNPDARGVEWQELAYYYVSTNQMPQAEQALRQAKAIETFPARGYRVAGEIYRTAGNYDQAVKELSAATSLEEYPPGYREKAVSLLGLNQWRSAHEELLKSLQLNPFSPITLSYLALVEDHLGMKTEASTHLSKAFTDSTVPPICYVNRAAIELNNNQPRKALADADHAIQIDPWLKEAYSVRSEIHQRLKNTQLASDDKEKSDKLLSHLDL
jgi:serine/threonine protein kinase/Tfp pilus assembly protein PilF